MKSTTKLFIAGACTTAIAAALHFGPNAGRYTLTCYDPGGAGDSQLVAEWSGLSTVSCNGNACVIGTRHHETVYVIPQGIACAVENEP